MATLGNDCYFFCTSTCAKGAACPFRHVEAAKTCRIICQHWQMGACLRPMCKFRHSDFVFQVDTGEVPCYWESQLAGCMKINCPYKHSKPSIQDEKTVIGAVSLQVDPAAATSSNSEDIKSQNIVQPVVTSAATQPSFDSEKTSSSQIPPTLQDSEIQVNTDKQKTESDDSKDSKVVSIQNISIEPQKPKVTTKKIKVSPVSKIKRKSVTAMKKKRKENDADSIAGRLTIKAKKNLHQPRKSIKERLGRAPVSRPVVSSSAEETDSESGSESDDSIENIKVMSVEEILRQKALESMMKKRAGEGKTKQRSASFAVIKEQTLLPSSVKKMSYPALDRETRTVQKNVHGLERRSKTYVTTTKKVKHVPAAVNRSSSSSSEESDSIDENKGITQLPESSSDTSDSLSASSSSDTDENSTDGSEELDIRRVVVDLESEKAARKKAKESFMKKQSQNAINTQDSNRKGRVIQHLPRQAKASAMEMTENREQRLKKRFVNVDYDSDDFICSRVQEPLKLHVRDRLGKSTSLHKASSDARLLSKTEKFGSEVVSTKVGSSKGIPVRIHRVSKSSSSEDEQTRLTEVKVKTLEEIRLEKMKIMAQKSEQKLSTREGDTDIQTLVSVKNRLGAPPGKMQKREVVHSEARQVVLLNGTKCDDTTGIKPSDEQKKTKKRPWRTVRPKTNPSAIEAIASDERTSIVSSPSSDRDDYSVELDHHKDLRVTDESPFERLRRRALQKKLQAEESKRFKKSPSVEEVKTVDDDSEKPECSQVVDTSTSVRTHKHKHGHKHKNVKTERKIYLPPAMKSAASKSSLISESLPPKQVLTMTPAPNVSPLKREPHPIAAAWAAGLALSSKGMSVRRLETIKTTDGNAEISSRIKVPEQFGDTDRSKEIVSSYKMPEPAPESSVTIKSFAEIMAEKRKRRLEMQAQKVGTADPSAAASVETSSSEPSMIYSSSASSLLPANSCPLKSAISHQSMDFKPTSPLISDQSSVTSKTVMQAGKAAKQSLMTTTEEVIPEITDFLASRVSSSAPVVPPSTLSSQGLVKSIGQKVKLKSTKKNQSDERKKNKVFTKRNDTQQSYQSCIVTSENSSGNFVSSSSYPDKSTLSQTVTSSTDNTTLLHVGLNKTSQPVSASAIETSSSQVFQNIATTGLNMADNGSVSTLPTHINSPDMNEQAYSSKQSVAVLKEESEHARKNDRLSLEDEFSFFEDEDMVVEDTSILENIEPIDDLLQDIDDLLS